jgi:glycosyltransferase involved in cell wall biosynthesis
MIVKNEEKFLPGCLESVKDAVDEIIIVDTGSTDKTIEIARSFNAKIFQIEWKNDFSLARNESINYATGDWILILDADERLEPKGAKKIKKYLNSNYDGYYVKVISLGKNGHPEAINEYPRLFRKEANYRFEGRIHEQISNSILKNGGKLGKADITIIHLGYAQDDETMSKKYERNLSILFEQLNENPNDAYTLYHIGIIKILKGETDEGISSLRKSISIPREKSNLNDSLRAVIYNILGKYELQNGDETSALNLLVKSIKLAPVQVSAYYWAGVAQMKKFNFAFAKNFLESALKNQQAILKGKSPDVAFENFINSNEITYKLAICYFKLGNFQKMNQMIEHISNDENSLNSFLNFLANEYIAGNNNAIQILRQISKIKPCFEVYKILSGIAQVEGDLENAVVCLKHALNFRDDDEIRYNLGLCLVGLRKFNEGIFYLSEFMNRESSEFFEDAIKVLAISYLAIGNYTDALRCYEILSNLHPTDEGIKKRILSISFRLTPQGK